MREAIPSPQPKVFLGDVARVVVERVWQRCPPQNGSPTFEPVIVVHVHLHSEAGQEGVIVLSPERFDQLAHEFAAVNDRVQEAARMMLRQPGEPPAGGSA